MLDRDAARSRAGPTSMAQRRWCARHSPSMPMAFNLGNTPNFAATFAAAHNDIGSLVTTAPD
jgi:hypothetical protein